MCPVCLSMYISASYMVDQWTIHSAVYRILHITSTMHKDAGWLGSQVRLSSVLQRGGPGFKAGIITLLCCQ